MCSLEIENSHQIEYQWDFSFAASRLLVFCWMKPNRLVLFPLTRKALSHTLCSESWKRFAAVGRNHTITISAVIIAVPWTLVDTSSTAAAVGLVPLIQQALQYLLFPFTSLSRVIYFKQLLHPSSGTLNTLSQGRCHAPQKYVCSFSSHLSPDIHYMVVIRC